MKNFLTKKIIANLKQIKSYFRVGEIYNHKSQAIQYRVQSIKYIINIINHLDKSHAAHTCAGIGRGIKLAQHIRRFSTTVSVLNDTKVDSKCPVLSVKVYENVELCNFQIVQENKTKAGVYRFINKTNGKSYIGSSSNLGRRFTEYLSIAYLQKQIEKGTSRISNSLLKHGHHSFSLEILEYCEENKATTREQYFLDLLNPEYNILSKAGSSLGYIHSEETKAKMSLA